jgi:hypothetical protein
MATKTEMTVSDMDMANMYDHEKQVVTQDEERTFETEADALPPGYFKSMYFIGTMFAAQSAWAAVSVFSYPFLRLNGLTKWLRGLEASLSQHHS